MVTNTMISLLTGVYVYWYVYWYVYLQPKVAHYYMSPEIGCGPAGRPAGPHAPVTLRCHARVSRSGGWVVGTRREGLKLEEST